MAGIFPEAGVQPGSAFPPGVPADGATTGCDILYYNARCIPRFDPIQANAVIAELMNVVRASPLQYDCNLLDNVALAVQYMIQQSIPNGLVGQGSILPAGTTLYTGQMTPEAIGYVDFMRVVLIPSETNIGPVNINIDGLGLRPVRRNDGQPLKTNDLLMNVPQELYFWNGAFYLSGLARSQVPLVLDGTVDFWIRTDGDDSTGDGSANTADKAFRTINGAWASVGSRYVGSPSATIRLRLGNPGLYAAARVSGFSGNVVLLGDTANVGGYVVRGDWAVSVDQIGTMLISGLTIKNDYTGADPRKLFLVFGTSTLTLDTVDFIIDAANPGHEIIVVTSGGKLYWSNSVRIIGQGAVRDIREWALAYNGGQVIGNENADVFATLTFENLNFTANGIILDTLAVFSFGFANIVSTAVTGVEYSVNQNSILRLDGKDPPGNVAGTTSYGGQVIT